MGPLLLGAAAAFFLTFFGIRQIRPWLGRRGVLDHPGERTNHHQPVPRGAGFALVPAIAIALGLSAAAGAVTGLPAGAALSFTMAALSIAVIGAIDDLTHISAGARLLLQSLFIGLAVAALPPEARFAEAVLPLAVERALAFLFLLAFVNATNFMDGIDGITGMSVIGISLGALLVALPGAVPALPVILMAACLAFLAFNWHPATIFLGDAGAVFLGFLTGSLLLALALSGEVAAAMVLPAYYLTDTGLTLARRAVRGEKVWLAHSQHAYQRAVRRGWRHDEVVGLLALLMVVEIGFAFLARALPIVGLTAAYGTALLVWLGLSFGPLDRLLPLLPGRRQTS
ncbi:MraY family glycosyltransferase [Afifella pfennigii]|uniref:hypothetical protein n=1 Tax=Afifella pfennigii TaxID=209897 RepID=UPI00068BAB45|nr:hypothetical protein [Afifella pfennigii]